MRIRNEKAYLIAITHRRSTDRRQGSLGLGALLVELKIAELVGVLVGGDDAEVITQLLLLHVLLGEVLEVALAEVDLGLNDDVSLVFADSDRAAEVAGLAIDLNAIIEEVREVIEHDDVVVDGKLAVEDELSALLLALTGLACLVCLAHFVFFGLVEVLFINDYINMLSDAL